MTHRIILLITVWFTHKLYTPFFGFSTRFLLQIKCLKDGEKEVAGAIYSTEPQVFNFNFIAELKELYLSFQILQFCIDLTKSYCTSVYQKRNTKNLEHYQSIKAKII
ncbi:Hypothetical_protein [Hexamita inflata]|uniref:Hypothetical_protein n=1 Tax=Hexamita inflata TaxID=28002 RepID=A0AA86UZK1_9EUKA|nr:Hypothetical protein HINF_LOCUS7784 [Hexamita inflata]CAI9978520.1 Hypothetical protein HINF_LOCUS66165 [Hexamita inflata]CAI9978526.1 Hypothetical protein HINF_LOCUS66171 [Hexamita inflata]